MGEPAIQAVQFQLSRHPLWLSRQAQPGLQGAPAVPFPVRHCAWAVFAPCSPAAEKNSSTKKVVSGPRTLFDAAVGRFYKAHAAVVFMLRLAGVAVISLLFSGGPVR